MTIYRVWTVCYVLLFLSSIVVGQDVSADERSVRNSYPLKITISSVAVSDDKTNARVIGELQNTERHLFLLSCNSLSAIIYQHFDAELMPDGKTYEVKDGTARDLLFPLDCDKNQEYKILRPQEVIRFNEILKLKDGPTTSFFRSGVDFELVLLYSGGDPSSKQKLTYWRGHLTSNSIFFRLSKENSNK